MLTMGVDISTYRCRVGRFVPYRGTGVMCLPIKIIGAVSFVRTLLFRAGIEQNPGPQDTYIFRYQYLLIEIGTTVLRETFDGLIGHDFVTYLASNRAASKKLTSLMTGKNRKITVDQEKLLPPKEQHPNSSMYDITLLTCLLRNVCGLSPAGDQVWMHPLPTDHSIEADITRLRTYRNELMHIDSVRLPETECNQRWQHLEQVLNRLNGTARIQNLGKLINDAKYMDIHEELHERYLETLEAWVTTNYSLDKLQKSELKLAQSELQEDVAKLKPGQSIFRYRYVVIDIGTNVLRGLFDKLVDAELRTYTKSLSDKQKKIRQSLGKNPDSSSFDLNFLTYLLRNVCGLLPPTNHVWLGNPASNNLSKEADITRLSNCRKEMMHGQTFVPEAELDSKIEDVIVILQRLNTIIGSKQFTLSIKSAKNLPLYKLVPADHNITGNIANQLLEPGIPELSILCLTSLSLHGIKMEHDSLENMVEYLSSNVCIQKINFSYMSCNNHQDSDTDCTLTLNLQKCEKLTSLCLYGVNIVCDRVNRSSLRSIKLYPISKRIVGSYIKVFNCIRGSNLEHLDIHGSLARYEGNTLESLTSAMKTLRNIKSLKLIDIHLPNDVSLQLHPDVTQVKIGLEHVTMSKEWFQLFTLNCVKAIYKVHVELDCCTITPVEDINSCFEEHETSANGATGISHLKSWQNTVHYICKYFTADIQVTHRDTCCLYYKSTQRD